MDSLAALKRRAVDFIEWLPLPRSLPSLPSHSSQQPYSLKGSWERISVPPLPRTGHSVDVVAGAAYIFGGETKSRRGPDNDIHVVILPSSGAQADYYAIKPKTAAPELRLTVGEDGPSSATELAAVGDVPAPRIGHATAVIGNRIFLYGGRPGPEAEPLDERGRVWVFDTKTHLWSHLDPELPVDPTVSSTATSDSDGARKPIYPAPRSFHSAVASEKPDHTSDADRRRRGAPEKPGTRTESWRQWALGDSDEVGTPQRPIIGNVASRATDADADGYGTLIIHGGSLTEGLASDTWAFDIRSRVWRELPSAPGEPRNRVALSISRSHLYRFGGADSRGEVSADLDVLELAVETFDDQSVGPVEVSLAARGTWRTFQQQTLGSGLGGPSVPAAESGPAAPLTRPDVAGANAWPAPRAGASLEALHVGGGWEYLVLSYGEGSADGNPAPLDDVWVFQVPPQGMSPASVHGAFLNTIGRKSGDGTWTKVELRPFDEDDSGAVEGPGPRGRVASAQVGDSAESAVFVWGGVDGAGRVLDDGWVLRLD